MASITEKTKELSLDSSKPAKIEKAKNAPKDKQKPKQKPKQDQSKAAVEGAALIGITMRKDGDFPSWYQQVLQKGDMLEYYDVSGCYIMKPWSYYVWEEIQRWFDFQIAKLGVENSYFPMFVSSKVLEREKDHIEGFAPEVAWVTKAYAFFFFFFFFFLFFFFLFCPNRLVDPLIWKNQLPLGPHQRL